MSAPHRERLPLHDPVDRPDAYAHTLLGATTTVNQRARARLKVASVAAGPDDLGHLLDMLGLGERAEIAAQLGHRNE